MTVVLFRIDERLIHGQVVLGWGSQLRPDRYVVVDDEVARSEWEQELYLLGLPEGTEGLFLDVAEARRRLERLEQDEVGTVILTRDVATMLRLARGGTLADRTVNIGGIHHGPGRRQVLPYLHLDDEDRQRLRELHEEGAAVSARDLPTTTEVPLTTLLEES